MTIHTEINFENAICEHFANHGWLYADGDASRYDRARALFPDDVLAWLRVSQPDAWDAATKSHGANAGEVIVGRLRDSINQRGTLDVLRNGFEMLGQRSKLSMMQVKPALEINPLGHRTAYLWEQVWERTSWLEIIGRYVIAKKNKKKQIESYIFPRYHQLDVTRKLQAAVLAEGPGQKYLIQHSAGSGKTNSIAWSAHFLSDLHYSEPQRASGGLVSGNSTVGETATGEPAASALPLRDNEKVFDSVLVVSDRNVIDGQLQDAVRDFERTTGVVAIIKGDGGSKSGELAEALSGDKKIIVCTIQTFPALQKKMLELTTQGKRFVVIADEAHSSQTGEAAKKLKSVLSVEEQNELEDGGEVSTEDILAAEMSTRASVSGIIYVAFTATPKAKTLELFGRCPTTPLQHLAKGPNHCRALSRVGFAASWRRSQSDGGRRQPAGSGPMATSDPGIH